MTNEKEEQECLPLILVSQINTIWTKCVGLSVVFVNYKPLNAILGG